MKSEDKQDRSRRKRRWSPWQISLRMLLVIVTLVGLALAYNQRFRRQQLVAQQLLDAKAKITYHQPYVSFLPTWVNDKLREVEAVDLSHQQLDEDLLRLLVKLPRLERLYLARTSVQDKHMKIIARLKNVKRLALWHTGITRRSMEYFPALENLEVLDVHGTRLPERSLEHFAKLKSLKKLIIDIETVTDDELKFLPDVPPMDLGDIRCTNVSDDGLRYLQKLDPSNFRITKIRNSSLTDEGLLALKDALGTMPIGPKFDVDGCPLTDRIVPALPWDRLTDVRFSRTEISFDAVAKTVGDRMKVLVISHTQMGMAEDWDWSLGRGWASKGLGIWMDQDPTALAKTQWMQLPNLNGIYLAATRPLNHLLDQFQDHRIENVEMGDVPRDTPVIEQIARWKHLKVAVLNCCNPRTKFDIAPLTNLQELQELTFHCTPFGDEGLAVIGNLSALRKLSITSGHLIVGSGLVHLKKLSHLKELEIQSKANWDESFDDLMSLDQVKRFKLIDIGLNQSHLQQFESRRGWWHTTWQ